MAVLVSIFGTASRHGGQVHGTAVAFAVATAFIAVALVLAIAFVRSPARR